MYRSGVTRLWGEMMGFNYSPDETEEIAQNVDVICRTMKGTQPMDRNLGIDSRFLDAAGTRGQALLSAAIIDDLPEQEPRVVVKQVSFNGSVETGQYEPVIEYEVRA